MKKNWRWRHPEEDDGASFRRSVQYFLQLCFLLFMVPDVEEHVMEDSLGCILYIYSKYLLLGYVKRNKFYYNACISYDLLWELKRINLIKLQCSVVGSWIYIFLKYRDSSLQTGDCCIIKLKHYFKKAVLEIIANEFNFKYLFFLQHLSTHSYIIIWES